MPLLTLHHADLCGPTLLCLSALSGSKEKTSWNCVCDFGLQGEPVCHDFPHVSDTWGDCSCLAEPSLKTSVQRAFQWLC